MELESCETTSSSWYRLSIAGLKISTFCLANSALFSLLISSSVFPENIEPQITSIHPLRLPWLLFSKNIVHKFYGETIKFRFDFRYFWLTFTQKHVLMNEKGYLSMSELVKNISHKLEALEKGQLPAEEIDQLTND